MRTISYLGLRVQQHPSAQPFFLMKATPDDLLSWADVPRKKSEYMAGYQRELDDRHKRIRKFLEKDPLNIIPGAIIVATRPGRVHVEAIDGQPDVYRLTVSTEQQPFEELLKSTYDEFLSRLSDPEKQEATSVRPPSPIENDDDPELPDDADDEDSPPDSYLAILTRELKGAVDDFGTLSPERQAAVREYVEGTAKPGLILDGQHRVFGAKDVEDHPVELPIVLIPDLPAQEQVFHFYVLNNKAVPLRPTELRGTISTSLSNKEIDALYQRLLQSGVKAEEARWTHRINTDAESPFRGMVDFGFGASTAFIPENVMFQIVSKFMKPPKRTRLVFSDTIEWTNDPEYRMQAFFVFWQTIKDQYPSAWEHGKAVGAEKTDPIFMKATMTVLQELILERFALDMPKRRQRNLRSPFANLTDLSESIRAELNYLPEEFFTREWQETGLDTPERRGFLLGQMKAAIDKLGERIGHLPLFKTKSRG